MRTLLMLLATFHLPAALAEDRPSTWLDHMLRCHQVFESDPSFSDADENISQADRYSFFAGTHNGNGGMWIAHDGMARFVEIPTGRGMRFLGMGGRQKGVRVPIGGDRELFISMRFEEEGYHGAHWYQFQIEDQALPGHRYTRARNSSPILDESIRPDLENTLMALARHLRRITFSEREPLLPPVPSGRVFVPQTDEDGNVVAVERPPAPSRVMPDISRLQRRDQWVAQRNQAQMNMINTCLESLEQVRPRPDQLMDLFRSKAIEIGLPQSPLLPDGSRGSPQTL